MSVRGKTSIQPELRRLLAVRDEAMNGDMQLAIRDAALKSTELNAEITVAADDTARRYLTFKLETSGGEVHDWCQTEFDIALTVTSTAGTAVIVGGATKATLEDGEAAVEIEFTGTWADGDTVEFTVSGATILGYAVADTAKTFSVGE